MSAEPIVYKEGLLWKRQRGLHTSNTRKLKFQERFCCLTNTSLDYYDPQLKKRAEGPKGQFAVEKMKIIEPMKIEIFGKEFKYAMQIGDQQEIMYFVTESETIRHQWLEAFKLASRDANVMMLPQHHHGVYGLMNKGRWSCCANPRRDTIGCSTTTGSTRKDLSLNLPPSKSPVLTEHSTSSLPRTTVQTPQSAPPPVVPMDTLSQLPVIRRFTTTDPLIKPNALKLRKMRQSRDFDSEKLSELDELEEESPKSPKIISEQLKNRQNLIIKKQLTSSYVANGNRSGASSPSPSDDSGRGTSVGNSRPNSQIEDNRIRAESLGKKPNHLVIQEQCEEECKGSQVEGSADSSKTVTPEETPVRKQSFPQATKDSEKSEEVIKDSEKSEEVAKDLEKPEEVTKDSEKSEEVAKDLEKPEEVTKGSEKFEEAMKNTGKSEENLPVIIKRLNDEAQDKVDGVHQKAVRCTSTPPPFETIIKQDMGDPRPLSTCSLGEGSLVGSGSEVSFGEVPQQRRVKEKLANSPRVGERPRSMLMKSFSTGQPPHNQLHQACKDGNLDNLAKILGDGFICSDTVNLEEPSNEDVPYTPLFIAFMNDHMQAMIRLLEYGANPNNTESVEKASVLHWACARGCMDVLDLLVKYKADVNQRDSAGNTPLMLACKNCHLDIVEFLLQNGASVDNESLAGRTPLHECCESGEPDIVDMLLKVGRADPTIRDQNDFSPYDIAFNNKNIEIMMMLQQVTPEMVRPYTLLQTKTFPRGAAINSLAFKKDNILITGSCDTHAHFLDPCDLSQPLDTLRLTDTILDLAVFDHTHLVIGSTSVQIVNIEERNKKQTVADDTQDDESLEDPPLHLVKFGPEARLVTASVESNMVKLWPPAVPQTGGVVNMPKAYFTVGEETGGRGCVYCLSMSPTPNCPWLAVGFQPGGMFTPEGNKLVYIYDWEKIELKQIFDAGEGGLEVGVYVTFSPCGRSLAIGSGKTLCIWDPKTGDLIQKFTIENGAQISSVSYSPNGSHLAAGLSNGEVQVFETTSSNPIFYLPRHKDSPVTALAYSESGKFLAAGQQNGCLQLWEAYGCVVSNSTDS